MGLSQADRRLIAERHAGLSQDPLPDMPEAPTGSVPEPPPLAPSWRRVPRSKRPPMCAECVAKAQAGGSAQVQRAVWARTQGDASVDLCRGHADSLRERDRHG